MSNIYNWDSMVTLKGGEMFSLQIVDVAPVGERAAFVNCTKNCLMLSVDVEINCNTATNVSHTFSHVKLPAGWFLICGRTIYSTAK